MFRLKHYAERKVTYMGFMTKLFGTHSDHELKRIYPIADRIEDLEPQMQSLTDEQLKAKTQEFKDRYQAGESLDVEIPQDAPCSRSAREQHLLANSP